MDLIIIWTVSKSDMVKLYNWMWPLMVALFLSACGGEEDSVFNLWEGNSRDELLDLIGYETDHIGVLTKSILGYSVKYICDIDFINAQPEWRAVIFKKGICFCGFCYEAQGASSILIFTGKVKKTSS